MKKKVLKSIFAGLFCLSFCSGILLNKENNINYAADELTDCGTYSGAATVKLTTLTNGGFPQIYFYVENQGTLPPSWDVAFKGNITKNNQVVDWYELKRVNDGGATFFFADMNNTNFLTQSCEYIFDGTFTGGGYPLK